MGLATRRVVVAPVGNRRYRVLGGGGGAELQLSRWGLRAVATVDGKRYDLRRTGPLDRGVSVPDPGGGAALLRLGRREARVPGVRSCTWRVRARLREDEATLRSPDVGSITLLRAPGRRAGVTASISGDWPGADLLVVAGAFVLLRRRGDERAAAVATAPAVVASG